MATRPATKEMPLQGPILPQSVAADVVPEYFEGYKPVPVSQKALPFKREFLDRGELLDVAFFRADQVPQLDGTPEAKYYRVLSADDPLPAEIRVKHPDLSELKYKDIFVGKDEPGYPFDASGFIARGGYVRVADRECRELYLAVRPIGAKDREQQLRANLSAEWQMRPDTEKGSPLVDMDVTDPKTGEKLLSSQIIKPSQNDSPIVTSGTFMPAANWSQMSQQQK